VDDPETGIVYQGVVRRIMDFGAFVEILPGKEGLVHISKLSRERIASVGDILHEGQEIPVKLMEIDKMGRLNLSYIDAIDPDGAPPPDSHPPHSGGYDRPPRGGGYDRPPRRDGGYDRGGRGGDRGGYDRPRYR
jgi:polyribonucleotide nucleotidyltransferase